MLRRTGSLVSCVARSLLLIAAVRLLGQLPKAKKIHLETSLHAADF